MRKTLWTLNIGNYGADLVRYTYPLLLGYAQKIGADFRILNSRAFPEHYPVTYEKLQIFDLGRGNDWNIFIDSDALIFPDLFDVTERVSKDTVIHYGRDHADNRFRPDNFFRRDGRNIGSANWFSAASDWCIDLWHPLSGARGDTMLDALAAIKPSAAERAFGMDSEHLIDDYVLSRNIARFGLKHITVTEMIDRAKDGGMYVWHTHAMTLPQKTYQIREIVAANGLEHLAEFREWGGLPLGSWLDEFGVTKAKSVEA